MTFTEQEIILEPNDVIYIFSDGYADQFGGESGRPGGKKLKATNFKRLLLSLQDKTIEKQGELIDAAFEDWKGSIEQLDDVCVIGVHVLVKSHIRYSEIQIHQLLISGVNDHSSQLSLTLKIKNQSV